MRWLAWALLAGSAFGQGDWKPPTAQPTPVEMPADGPPARSAIAAAVQQGVTAAMVPVIEALRDLRVQMAATPAPVTPVVAAPVAPGPTNPIPWEAILATLSGIAAAFVAKSAAVNTVRRERGPPRRELAAAVQQQAVQGQPVAGAVAPVAPPGFRLVPVPAEEVTP